MRPIALVALATACMSEPGGPGPSTGDPMDPASGSDTDPTPPLTDGSPEDPPELPAVENVLFVLIDDLGADSVGLYDPQGAPATPTIDALAAEGTVFDHAWAMPLCSPTRAALLTGRYPHRNGTGMVMEYEGLEDGAVPLREAELTLPEMLAGASSPWDTSLTGKWHLSPYEAVLAGGPGDHGFAWHAGSPGNLPEPIGYYDWQKNDNGTLVQTSLYTTTDTANDAIDRITAMPEPWFLLLAFNAPHDPYEAPPSELAPGPFEDRRALYGGMVTAMDVELGRVLATMPEDVRARTTIVVMGDNGSPDDLDLADLDEGRLKGSVYEGGVHVPLVVAGPRVGVPGSRSPALVNVVDWYATIAEIAGVELASAPTAGPVDGVSLLPVLADPSATVRETSYTEAFFSDRDEAASLRDERYALVAMDHWSFHRRPATGIELYDLVEDPGQERDLADDPAHAEVYQRLLDEMLALREDLGAH